MQIARNIFFVVLAISSCIWAAMAITAQYVRLEHRSLIAEIRQNTAVVTLPELDTAIAKYEHALQFVPCNAGLYKDISLLTAYGTDIAMAQNMEDDNYYLAKTLDTLESLVACSPMDGKAWLDIATLNNFYEGFTDNSLNAYKMSQRVTAGESWLAQKRLLFALQFLPLFDKEALAAARSDIATLQRAHPNHLTSILKAAEVKKVDELYGLFYSH